MEDQGEDKWAKFHTNFETWLYANDADNLIRLKKENFSHKLLHWTVLKAIAGFLPNLRINVYSRKIPIKRNLLVHRRFLFMNTTSILDLGKEFSRKTEIEQKLRSCQNWLFKAIIFFQKNRVEPLLQERFPQPAFLLTLNPRVGRQFPGKIKIYIKIIGFPKHCRALRLYFCTTNFRA